MNQVVYYISGFAKNLFNFGDDSGVGNKVDLVSNTQSYPCDIHKDGCHEKQITCYTRYVTWLHLTNYNHTMIRNCIYV